MIYIQEGYLFSDKTISVDLDKFESGESNKLLVIGLIGAGKTTLAHELEKKYKVKAFHTDDCENWNLNAPPHSKEKLNKIYNCSMDFIKSNERSIIEGAVLIGLFFNKKYNKDIINKPMIILGKSAIKSSYQALIRNKKREQRLKLSYTQAKLNLTLFQKQISQLKKERIKHSNNVQEFEVPKL